MTMNISDVRLLRAEDKELFGVYIQLKHTTSWAFSRVLCTKDESALIFERPFVIYNDEERSAYLPFNYCNKRIYIIEENYFRGCNEIIL